MVSRAGRAWAWVFAVIMLLAGSAAWAGEEDVVRIEGDAASFPLAGRFYLLADRNPALTLDDVIPRGDFRKPERERLEGGVRWYRVTVVRGVGMPSDWILAFGEPDINDVRVFVPREDGGVSETQIGRRIPSQDLALAGRRHLARISLPEGKPATLYLRLASDHKIRFEDAALWHPDALMYAEARESTLLGIRAGVLLLLVAGYTLFGLWVRDGAMLLYALYVGTILSRGLNHTGLITLVVPQAAGQTSYWMGAIGLLGGVSAFVLMWDRILGLRTAMPVMHGVYLAVGALMLVPLLLIGTPVFPLAVRASHSIMLLISVVSLVLAAAMVRRDPANILLKFYLVAFLPVVAVGFTRVAAMVLPIVPVELGRFLDVSSINAHIGILGLALAYRLGRMQQDRARIREELAGERRIQEHLRAFLDMVSHEFKTPLAVIDSAAQVLELQHSGREDTVQRLVTIRRSVKRLVGLIETCLAGERHERVEIKPAPVSPAAIVRQAAERNRLPDRPDVKVIPDETDQPGMADANLLGIALDALIDNARRYGPVDGVVEIVAHSANGRFTLAVLDRGPGVPKNDAEHIFDKYYRSPSTSSVAGTGIGLHLVKTIAELHGGTVDYAPRPGGGAIFTLTIPTARTGARRPGLRTPAPA